MTNSSSIVPIAPTQLPISLYPKKCDISDQSEYVTPFLLALNLNMISDAKEKNNDSLSLSGSWEGGDLLPPFKHDPLTKQREQNDQINNQSNDSNLSASSNNNVECPLSFHIYNDRSNLLYETNCSNSNKKGYVNLFPKSTKSIRALSQLFTINWLKESSLESSGSSLPIKINFDGEFMIENQLAHEVTLNLNFSLLNEKEQSFNQNFNNKNKYVKIFGEGVTMGKVIIHFVLKGEAALDMATGKIGMDTPIFLYRFDQPPLEEISDERSYVHKTIKPLLFSRGWTFPSHPPRSFTLLYEGSCWKPPSGDWKTPKQGRDFIHKSHLAEFLLGDDKAFVDEIFRGLGVQLLVDMLPGLRQRLLVKERFGISSSSTVVDNISQTTTTPKGKNMVHSSSKTPTHIVKSDDNDIKNSANFLDDSTPQAASSSLSRKRKSLNSSNSGRGKKVGGEKDNVEEDKRPLSKNTEKKREERAITKEIDFASISNPVSSKTPATKTKSKGLEKVKSDSKSTPIVPEKDSLHTRSVSTGSKSTVTSTAKNFKKNNSGTDRMKTGLNPQNPLRGETQFHGRNMKPKTNNNQSKSDSSSAKTNTTSNTTTASALRFRHEKPGFKIYEDTGEDQKKKKIVEKDQKSKQQRLLSGRNDKVKKKEILKDLTNSTLNLKADPIHDKELCVSKSYLLVEKTKLPIALEKSKDFSGKKQPFQKNYNKEKERSKRPLTQYNGGNSIGLRDNLYQKDESTLNKDRYERDNKENFNSAYDSKLVTSKSENQNKKHKNVNNEKLDVEKNLGHMNSNVDQTTNEKVLLSFKRKRPMQEESKDFNSNESEKIKSQGSGSLEISIVKKPRTSHGTIDSKKACTLNRFSRIFSKDQIQTAGSEIGENNECNGDIKRQPPRRSSNSEICKLKSNTSGPSEESLLHAKKSTKSLSRRKSTGSRENKQLHKEDLPPTNEASNTTLRLREGDSSSLKKRKDSDNIEISQESNCSYVSDDTTPIITGSRKRRRSMYEISQKNDKIMSTGDVHASRTSQTGNSKEQSMTPVVRPIPLHKTQAKLPNTLTVDDSERKEENKTVNLSKIEDKKSQWFCKKMKEFTNFRLPISHFSTSAEIVSDGAKSLNYSEPASEGTTKSNNLIINHERQCNRNEELGKKKSRCLKIWERVENTESEDDEKENNAYGKRITQMSTTNPNIEKPKKTLDKCLLQTPKTEKNAQYVGILTTSTIVYRNDDIDLLRLFKVHPKVLKESSTTPAI